MYYARCLHPPGGATALAAVIGGPNIHALGYEYILTPIAINTVTILLVALLFNALFRWRRYPSFLIPKASGLDSAHKAYAPVDHASFVYALSQMDTFIDVTEDDLLKIYQLATGREVNSNSE
jgi:CBS-domain-containing membrane protein